MAHILTMAHIQIVYSSESTGLMPRYSVGNLVGLLAGWVVEWLVRSMVS